MEAALLSDVFHRHLLAALVAEYRLMLCSVIHIDALYLLHFRDCEHIYDKNYYSEQTLEYGSEHRDTLSGQLIYGIKQERRHPHKQRERERKAEHHGYCADDLHHLFAEMIAYPSVEL